MRLALLLHRASLILSTLSLSPSQAVSDWQKTFIGVPQVHSPSLSPSFHRVPLRDGKALVFLLTATQRNVLAAVDPSGSTVAWRHISEDYDPILAYESRQDGLIMVSGPGGSTVRLLEVTTGKIIWETGLHSLLNAYPLEPQTLGVAATFAADLSPDIFVLSNGHTITRLNGLSGAIMWSWSAMDQTSSILYTQLIVTTSGVYALGFLKGILSFNAHITSLDASTGALIASQTVRSAVADVSKNILLLNNARLSPHALLVWVESGSIQIVNLTPELPNITPIVVGEIDEILNVQLNSFGMIVGLTKNKTSSVFALSGPEDGLRQIWEFKDSASSAGHSDSVFGGGLDKEGRPYISRTYWTNSHRACNMELFAPHGAAGKGSVIGQTFPFDTIKHGVLLHTAIEVAWIGDLKYISRFAITTSSGSFQVWQQDRNQWVREESLSAIEAATFVDLPQSLATGGPLAPKGLQELLAKQSVELHSLPAYIAQLVKRFAIGSTLPSDFRSVVPARDTFGFRKYIIVVTSYGKIFALDSFNGEVIWSQLLSISPNNGLPLDATVRVIATKHTDTGRAPEIFLAIATSTRKGARTHVFHFDALSGVSLGLRKAHGYMPSQYEVESGLLDVFMVRGGVNGFVLITSDLNAHVYPDLAVDTFSNATSDVYLSIAAHEGSLNGYIVSTIPTGRRNVYPLHRVWSTTLGADIIVEKIIKPNPRSAASFGKVLGNRTTLYKYLNPHAVAVITTTAKTDLDEHNECGIWVVDRVKGTILYHAAIFVEHGPCHMGAALVDNWLVYYHYEGLGHSGPAAKGNRITSVEMYESSQADDKTKSSETSGHCPDQARLSVIQQSFVLPHAIQKMAVTSTKFGIALRDIIAVNAAHQVLALPHRSLDPGRQKGARATEEREERLAMFDPVFTEDARRVLSHTHEVALVKDILTYPSELESTTLVFTYGLDLFQTRVSPSGTFDLLSEDFNRFQLLVTIAALGVAILITRPLVTVQTLKRQWY